MRKQAKATAGMTFIVLKRGTNFENTIIRVYSKTQKVIFEGERREFRKMLLTIENQPL